MRHDRQHRRVAAKAGRRVGDRRPADRGREGRRGQEPHPDAAPSQRRFHGEEVEPFRRLLQHRAEQRRRRRPPHHRRQVGRRHGDGVRKLERPGPEMQPVGGNRLPGRRREQRRCRQKRHPIRLHRNDLRPGRHRQDRQLAEALRQPPGDRHRRAAGTRDDDPLPPGVPGHRGIELLHQPVDRLPRLDDQRARRRLAGHRRPHSLIAIPAKAGIHHTTGPAMCRRRR